MIDGGNTRYHDDIRRARELAERGIHYVDVGTSGGVFGLERGFCLMVGGEDGGRRAARAALRLARAGPRRRAAHRRPHRATLAGGARLAPLRPGRRGHFVKMVHNGIEYGLMAAYAEGLNLLHHASAEPSRATPTRRRRRSTTRSTTATTSTSRRSPRSGGEGSVVASWLLDLTAAALHESPALDEFGGRVSDSGEGRWTSIAAIETGTPAPVLTAALFERFSSRGEADFANRVLSAMRKQFGGHAEKPHAGRASGADAQTPAQPSSLGRA